MIKRMLIIFFIMIMIFSIIIPTVKASSIIENTFEEAQNWRNEANSSVIDDRKLKPVSDTIYNALLMIGTVATVIIATILGIKYMIGSISEQAKIKQTIVPFIVGCIIIFGAFIIWKLMVNVLQKTGI